jgi:hypothetical protein
MQSGNIKVMEVVFARVLKLALKAANPPQQLVDGILAAQKIIKKSNNRDYYHSFDCQEFQEHVNGCLDWLTTLPWSISTDTLMIMAQQVLHSLTISLELESLDTKLDDMVEKLRIRQGE